MILHDKIEKHCGFFFNAWIKFLSTECLINGVDRAFERLILFVSKQVTTSELFLQKVNGFHCFFIGGTKFFSRSRGVYFQLLVIVFIKRIQTVSVIGNHTQESIGLIQRQLFVFDDVRKKTYGALQVCQLGSFDLLINGVTLNQIVFQDFVRPDTELGATL